MTAATAELGLEVSEDEGEEEDEDEVEDKVEEFFLGNQSSRQASTEQSDGSNTEATLILCGYSGERANTKVFWNKEYCLQNMRKEIVWMQRFKTEQAEV